MKTQISENQFFSPELKFLPRRDQLTIIADLLELIKQPTRLTHILYKSNMSYSQLVKYLGDMIDLGIAEEKKLPHKAYKITSKGMQFLEIFDKKTLQKISEKRIPY